MHPICHYVALKMKSGWIKVAYVEHDPVQTSQFKAQGVSDIILSMSILTQIIFKSSFAFCWYKMNKNSTESCSMMSISPAHAARDTRSSGIHPNQHLSLHHADGCISLSWVRRCLCISKGNLHWLVTIFTHSLSLWDPVFFFWFKIHFYFARMEDDNWQVHSDQRYQYSSSGTYASDTAWVPINIRVSISEVSINKSSVCFHRMSLDEVRTWHFSSLWLTKIDVWY